MIIGFQKTEFKADRIVLDIAHAAYWERLFAFSAMI